MTELDADDLASHRALHEKALTVAPKFEREPGEFWAAVLEPDKNVSNWELEDLHWFKVKGKHTVAKVQKAYHKKCGSMTLLHQGNHVVSLTSQMQQVNHFKDDIIVFWSTRSVCADNTPTTSRPPLQSVDTAIQNRMPSGSHTNVEIKPDPELAPVRMKTEAYVSHVSPSPSNIPATSWSLPQPAQFGTPTPLESGSAKTSTPASERIAGYNVYADAHRQNYWNSKASLAAVETALMKSWTALTPALRQYWESEALKTSSNTPTPANSSAPNLLLGFESFAETHRANYASSRATPSEIASSLRRTWDKMPAETREYYSKQAVEYLDSPASNNGCFSPGSVVDTRPLRESPDSSAIGHVTSISRDNTLIGPEDNGFPSPKDEDGSPEADLPTAELAKSRLQNVIEHGSPEVLEAEVKKTNDFLTVLKTRFNVPEAESHQDTKHWLQQIETLQAQDVDSLTIIGVVGNTGAGKSSVINAILDEERLIPTNCMRACTAVVTEISWNPNDDPNKKYTAEIEFIKAEDWKKDLKISLADLINDSGKMSRESSNAEADAGVAYAKIKAVYPSMTKEMIEASSVEEMLAHVDVQRVLGTTKIVEKSNPEFFYKELQRYVDSREKSTGEKGRKANREKRVMEFWPLIKVVRIFVKADVLSTGAVIVDLPGVHDSNAARAAVAAGYMKQCTGLWVCAPINRAVDDKAAKSLLGESFKRQLKYDGRFSRITFICSKTDDISVLEASDSLGLEEAMAEDSAKIDEIDEELDQLNAKITEMKESIEVYGSIFSDADETFDIWDDLRRDAEDGKTIYAPKVKDKSPKRKRKRSPPPKKSRKKAKRSGYEDHEGDFVDDYEDEDEENEGEVSDNESEAEEEDFDMGEPLTIEAIDEKLDELKDTKKKARKEKAALQVEIKDVTKRLRELDEAKQEIDTRMRAKCIDGRNKYSKGAIQQDFAAGIKELDNINAEEEDEENFDPENEIRDYEAVARSLPVFCVSSRAYQQLNGRLQKDAKIPGFRYVEETEIPQLKAHCKMLTEAGRSANCHRFLNSVLQIILSLSLWAESDGTGGNLSDSQNISEARWLQNRLKDLEDELYKAVRDCIVDMKDALNENLFEKFGEVIPLAVDQAPQMVSKWGATVNRFDRDAGGLYWSTYKSICRRYGGPYTNSNGTHDWNSQLIEPIMKHLASNWEKSFSRRLPSTLQGFTKKSKWILKSFHQDVEARSRKNGAGIAGLAMLTQQLRTHEATFSILTTEMVEAINTLQREANREFVPVIAKKLASAYTWCAREVGGGQFKRIKDHMHNHIDQSRHSMFTESCNEVKTRLNEMCQQVEENMNNKTHEVFMLMRRDYLQVLNGTQVSGEFMPKWERHMRSEIARTLEKYEKDEAEKVATGVKDEEPEEDKIMKDSEAEEADGDKSDESVEESAAQADEPDVETDEMAEIETAAIKNEQPVDNETDNNQKKGPPRVMSEVDSFNMDVNSPVVASPSEKASSTGFPSAGDSSTDAPSTEAASAKVPSSEILSTEAFTPSSSPS